MGSVSEKVQPGELTTEEYSNVEERWDRLKRMDEEKGIFNEEWELRQNLLDYEADLSFLKQNEK